MDALRVIQCGGGFMGRVHASSYAELAGVELAGIVDPGQPGRELATQLGVPHFADLGAALAAGPSDIVDVCVPTFLHEEYAVAALDAGRAVLCEKPMALTEAAATRMCAAAAASGRQLMIAQTLRFWPEYEVIAAQWRSGQLGEEVMATAVRLGQLPVWSDWYADPALSGGGALELHVHDIDYLVFLFGRVRSVHSVGWKNGRGAWNHVVTALTFEGGQRASAEGGVEMTPGFPFTMGLRLAGTRATLDFRLRAGANLDERGETPPTLWRYAPSAEPEPLPVPAEDAYRREIAYFVERVRHGEATDTVPVEESLHVLKVMLAIRRSLESGDVETP